ncbi:hypothetical protein LguiB_027484 [Lonicera macranthoides]
MSKGGVVTVGGKGSSLSSNKVFEVANGLSQVRIDASAFARLSSSNSTSTSPQLPNNSSIPNYLTQEEVRASLFVILNKKLLLLLLSSASGSSSTSAVVQQELSDLLNVLNSSSSSQSSNTTTTTTGDATAALQGISALLDHRASALSTVADAVASLSCEALKADVASAFALIVDSGDGTSDKDRVVVANDFKTLLNGSKLVGKQLHCPDQVSDIPKVHGRFRSVSRSLHSAMRVELNSVAGCGTGKDLATVLSPLALALQNLGETSWGRAKLIIDSSLGLGSNFVEIFNMGCPNINTLVDLIKCSQAAYHDKDYVKSLHEIYNLSEIVRKILSWEAAIAFLSLDGSTELTWGLRVAEELSGENAKGGETTKKNKEKRKKVVLGKGTTVLVQLLIDRLNLETTGVEDCGRSALLEKWARDFLSILNPTDPGFEFLLKKVKEIVDSNESRRLPKLPKGTRDFAKEQMAVREKAFSIIGDVFKRHGAMALDTPAFELRETLMGKYGEDSKLIYDLADQGGELCSLRYDLTVPFARFVAMNGLTSFKRYQIAKVYRRDNPSKGRYREFYQCDFDIAGQYEKMGPDSEVVLILTELLDELNIGDYEVKLNHRKLLDGMLDICGVPPEKFRTICSSIDKLDKQPFEQIRKEMVDEKGLNVEAADTIGTFVKRRGRPLELLSELKQEGSKFIENSASLAALNDLEILFKALEKAGCIDRLVLDLSLARGLDYYTGVIFEAVFKGATQVGSIAAGGRYDNLIGMFGTKQVPAVGVSLGIERVFTIMEQLQRDKNQAIRASETEILVSVLGDDLSLAFEMTSKCWKAKLKAEYMVHKKVQKHIQRANELRIRWMAIIGETELSRGVVKLKDLNAGKEEDVPITTFVEELHTRLRSSP